MTETPDRSVTVCVATFRRPAQLGDLLAALSAQVLEPADGRLEVVVADNDPAGSAEPIVRREPAWPMPTAYLAEPVRGVAAARNAAVAAVPQDRSFIAFIDDDELPPANWLQGLLAAQAATAADVVVGPVLPRYDEPPPAWVEAGHFHRTPRTWPSSGDGLLDEAWCGNVLVRRSLLGDVPFPLVFGASGGEDSVLFRSLSRSGARIVFAPEAAVEERIPRDRVRLPWLLQRAFREGLIVGRRERHFGARSPAIVVIIVRALAKVVVGGVEVAIGLGRGSSAAAVAGAWRILTGLGTIGGLADLRSSPYGVRR